MPVSKKRTMSFTNRMEKSTATAKSAGPKPGSPDGSGSSYTLYDSCNKCPLRAYIEMVCNDNLRALVIGGNPPEEVLQEVRMALVAEFHELSGNALCRSLNNRIREVQLCRMRILGLSIAAQLLAAELTRREAWENELDAPAADGEGRSEDREEQELSLSQAVLRFLNRNGLPVQVLPGDETGWRKLAGRIDAKIRALKIKSREEKRRYEALLEGNGRESCTPGEFNDQLVALSKHAGFRLTPDISLAEYAGYLKDYKNTLRYDKRSK